MHASDYACTVHESKHAIMCQSVRPLLPFVCGCCYVNLHAAQAINKHSCVQRRAGFCLAQFAYLLPGRALPGSSGCQLRLFRIAGISITAQEH